MSSLRSRYEANRGIYFISTLVVTGMISMLILSAVLLSGDSLKASRHLTTGDTALKAAESGLRYAQSRLGEDPMWRGDGDARTVEQEGLIVEEQDGNVIGVITGRDGTVSQFRIRFNWQDDSGLKEDPFSDPPSDFLIEHPYISVNNVTGGSSREVPRGDGPAGSVTPTSSRLHAVPPGVVFVAVEGRSGPGLYEVSDTVLNPKLTRGQISARYIEAHLEIGERPGANAAAMAAGDFRSVLDAGGSSQVVVDSKSGVPRIRSKGNVEVVGGKSDENYVSDDGEVHSVDGSLKAGYLSQQQVTTEIEQADAGFYKLGWEDVKKAQPEDYTLDAGTYVVWDDGSLHYYDMSYQQYLEFMSDPNNQSNPGTLVGLDSDALSFDGKKLQIKENIFVQSTSKTDEFNFIPRAGAQENPKGESEGGAGEISKTDVVNFPATLPTPSKIDDDSVTWNLTNVIDLPSDFDDDFEFEQGGREFELELEWDDGKIELDFKFHESYINTADTDTPQIYAKALSSALGQLHDGYYNGYSDNHKSFRNIMSHLVGSSGMSEIPLEDSIPAETTADDLEVEFAPESGSSAILSADGNISIGSRVKGEGGSVTSQGNIRFVGAGSDLSADVEEGLNLYAKGDIILSSLKPKSNGEYDYKDFILKGVLYAWGDILVKVGSDHESVNSWGKFEVQGAVVAYGNRALQSLADSPGQGEGGSIELRAKEVKLTFDSAYLSAIQNLPEPGVMTQTFYSVR